MNYKRWVVAMRGTSACHQRVSTHNLSQAANKSRGETSAIHGSESSADVLQITFRRWVGATLAYFAGGRTIIHLMLFLASQS